MRLQAVPRSITKRASELGVLLVHYSKLRSAHSKPTNGSVVGFEQIEDLMFCWHPTKEELNHWVDSKASIDTIFREVTQDRVEAMDKEVAGLRERFTRTL